MTLKEAKAALAAAQAAHRAAEEESMAAGRRARDAYDALCAAKLAVERAKPLGKRAKTMLESMLTAPVLINAIRYHVTQEERTASELVELGFAISTRRGGLIEFAITDAGRVKLGDKP